MSASAAVAFSAAKRVYIVMAIIFVPSLIAWLATTSLAIESIKRDNRFYKNRCESINLGEGCLDKKKFDSGECKVSVYFEIGYQDYYAYISNFHGYSFDEIQEDFAIGKDFTCYYDITTAKQGTWETTVKLQKPTLSGLVILSIVFFALVIGCPLVCYMVHKVHRTYLLHFIPEETWVIHVNKLWSLRPENNLEVSVKPMLWGYLFDVAVSLTVLLHSLIFLSEGFALVYAFFPVCFFSLIIILGFQLNIKKNAETEARTPSDEHKHFIYKSSFFITGVCFTYGYSFACLFVLLLTCMIYSHADVATFIILSIPCSIMVLTRIVLYRYLGYLFAAMYKPELLNMEDTPAPPANENIDDEFRAAMETDDDVIKTSNTNNDNNDDEDDLESIRLQQPTIIADPGESQQDRQEFLRAFRVPMVVFFLSTFVSAMVLIVCSATETIILASVTIIPIVASAASLWTLFTFRPSLLPWVLGLFGFGMVYSIFGTVLSAVHERGYPPAVTVLFIMFLLQAFDLWGVSKVHQYYNKRYNSVESLPSNYAEPMLDTSRVFVIIGSIIGLYQMLGEPLLLMTQDLTIGYWTFWFGAAGLTTFAMVFDRKKSANVVYGALLINFILLIEQCLMLGYHELKIDSMIIGVVIVCMICEIIIMAKAFRDAKAVF